MRRFWKYLLLFLYSFFIFVAVVYVNLPYTKIASYYLQRACRGSGISIQVGRIKPLFPPGWRVDGVGVFTTVKGGAEELFAVKNAEVKIRYSGIFGEGEPIVVHAKAYRGKIVSRTDFTFVRNPGEGHVAFEFHDLHLSDYPPLQKLLPTDISGKLEGELRLQPASDILRKGELSGRLVLKHLSVTLPERYAAGIGRLDFSAIRCVFSLKNGLLKLQSLDVDGRGIRAGAEGTMLIQNDISEARLAVRGVFKLMPPLDRKLGFLLALLGGSAEANKELRFSISGTVEKPQFKITGTAF